MITFKIQNTMHKLEELSSFSRLSYFRSIFSRWIRVILTVHHDGNNGRILSSNVGETHPVARRALNDSVLPRSVSLLSITTCSPLSSFGLHQVTIEEFAQAEGTRILKKTREIRVAIETDLVTPAPKYNWDQNGQSADQYSVLGDDFDPASSSGRVLTQVCV